MKKKETYRRLVGCANCFGNQEFFVPKGLVWKEYVIPPETLCTNCGCRLDGKDTPKPVEHNCDNCEHQPNAVLYCQFQPTECRYYTPKPPEPAETAFRRMVRDFLAERFENQDYIECPWSDIVNNWSNKISLVRNVMNATLELAKEQTCNCHFCLQAGNASLRIEALKEKAL